MLNLPLISQKPVGKQAEFHRSPAMERVVLAGNRSGKTHCGAREAAFWLLGCHPFRKVPAAAKGWAICLDRDTAIDILIPKVLEFIPEELQCDPPYTRGDVPELRVKTGGVLRFKSAASGRAKFQSAAIDFAWADEEQPEDIIEETRTRLIDRKGSMWMTLTPLQGKTWMYHKVLLPWQKDQISRADLDIFRWSIKDNNTLPQDAVDKFLLRVPDHMRPARERGEFVDLEGLIWPMFNEAVHLIEPFDIPHHWPLYIALDPGYKHPFGASIGVCSERGDKIIIGEYNANRRTIRQHAEGILAVVEEVAPWKLNHAVKNRVFRPGPGGTRDVHHHEDDVVDAMLHIDPSAAQIREEFHQFGMVPTDANRDVTDGINRIGELFTLSLRDLPGGLYLIRGRTPYHVDQLRTYSWKRDDKTNKERPQELDDDNMDSLRYFGLMPHEAATESLQRPKRGTLAWWDQFDDHVDFARSLRGNERATELDLFDAVEDLLVERGW